MDHRPALEVRFPPANEPGEVRGMLHRPRGPTVAGLVVTHGRSGDLRNRLVRRIAETAAEIGLLALRMNFRYVDEKSRASRDLRREEDELRGAVRFLRKDMGDHPIFIAGTSMGARVCARASSDPDVAGVITLGYPLHPRFRPEVQNPPEWPLIVKPVLVVQGDQDPFCDLARLRDELRNGRGQYRGPGSDGRRPPPRRNVSASPGLLALESRRLPDRARRDGCERLSRRPLRLERSRSDAGTAPLGRRPEPLGRSRERDAEPRTQLGPEPGSRPRGRPRPAGGQRDRPRPGEWLS